MTEKWRTRSDNDGAKPKFHIYSDYEREQIEDRSIQALLEHLQKEGQLDQKK